MFKVHLLTLAFGLGFVEPPLEPPDPDVVLTKSATCGCSDCTCNPCKCVGATCTCKDCGVSGREFVLFVTHPCPYCDTLETKLKKLGVRYVKVDNVALKSYPMFATYRNKKLVSYVEGDQSEVALKSFVK